jgi:hypothetical protein
MAHGLATGMTTKFAPEHYEALKAIRWAVETSNLHQLAERRERTLDELVAEPA